MHRLANIRSGKPDFYPDQSIYAEYACAEFGLTFEDISAGAGVVFSVASNGNRLHFGAGRCSWYPQNSATASTLASDKYLTNTILERAGIATLGGDYFFLDDRRRALRPAGHERADALRYFRTLGASAFVKPLFGSRGDFAQAVHGEAALARYLDEVSQCYDFDPDPAAGPRDRVPGFSARRRGGLYRAEISTVGVGRWRALDPRSSGRAQCGSAIPRSFAGFDPRRNPTIRSTPCCPRAAAGKFPDG